MKDYFKLLKENLFIDIEKFSNHFVNDNVNLFSEFSNRWLLDPLHHWSRQWEYPFTFYHINQHQKNISNNGKTKILDAGSGFTFFPYYLTKKLDCELTCVDQDSYLVEIFQNVNKKENANISFMCSDLRNESLEKKYDVIYCVSVLEHTNNYKEILDGFDQILKNDGLFIVTFDVSLNKSGINLVVAQKLLEDIEKRFLKIDNYGFDVFNYHNKEEILTTRNIWKINKEWLPWKPSRRHSFREMLNIKHAQRHFLSFLYPKMMIPDLTVFCGVFKKRDKTN